MKVITVCPVCQEDFMYDPTWDHHLLVKMGDDWNFICQDCFDKAEPDYIEPEETTENYPEQINLGGE